ncbi:MAG TPA: type II toxin-antitoxin system VapC family toxin [Isosphaeraceae bacterium]|nr:type II toxin-antitoxin system VapC family toxin [Isosphaeraceae bacterium]
MRYILDSNVALKWVPPEADDAKAIRVRDEFQRGIHELLSPDVFPIEVAHSLARAERRGQIKPGEGAPKMAYVFTYMPDLHRYLPLLSKAFAIASQARIGVYDCLYVVLAEREGCELLTADDRLVRAIQATFPFITSLASSP